MDASSKGGSQHRDAIVDDQAESDIQGDTAAIYGGGLEQHESSSSQSTPSEHATSEVVCICKHCMTSSGRGERCPECGGALVPIRPIQDSYVGVTIGDGYEIVGKIGEGGMGEVYLGEDPSLGQQVAVKFLSRDYTANETLVMRFLNEARSYGQINHPNAVTLLDYGQHEDGALYIMTEYVEGKSLTDAVRQRGGLSPAQVVSIATQCCEVLTAAHRRGIIHRDLKPENLMLVPGGGGRYTVKVLDFGIAKVVDEDRAPLTETGAVFGTPEFMSPEQASGSEVDPRSDLYALGIIMFYALTGTLPFEGESQFVLLNKQVNESPPSLSAVADTSEIPSALESIVLNCLNKEPEARYESAEALAEALDTVESSASGASSSSVELDAPTVEGRTSSGDDRGPEPLSDHRDDAFDGAEVPRDGARREPEIGSLGRSERRPVPIDFEADDRDRVRWVGLTLAGLFSMGIVIWAMGPPSIASLSTSSAAPSSDSPSSRSEAAAGASDSTEEASTGLAASRDDASDQAQANSPPSDRESESPSDDEPTPPREDMVAAESGDEKGDSTADSDPDRPSKYSEHANDDPTSAEPNETADPGAAASPSAPSPSREAPPSDSESRAEPDETSGGDPDESSEDDSDSLPEGMALPPKQID